MTPEQIKESQAASDEIGRLSSIIFKMNAVSSDTADFIVDHWEDDSFVAKAAPVLIVFHDAISALLLEAKTGRVGEHIGIVKIFRERMPS